MPKTPPHDCLFFANVLFRPMSNNKFNTGSLLCFHSVCYKRSKRSLKFKTRVYRGSFVRNCIDGMGLFRPGNNGLKLVADKIKIKIITLEFLKTDVTCSTKTKRVQAGHHSIYSAALPPQAKKLSCEPKSCQKNQEKSFYF